MNEIIFLVEDAAEGAEGGFSARALGHATYTAADTERELQEMVKDAVACHFDDGEAPAVIRLAFTPAARREVERLATSAS